MQIPKPNFSHLLSMSGPFGTYEHANYDLARVEHGYCIDDVARVLMVVSREPDPDADLAELARSSMRFLQSAQGEDGRFRNRRSSAGVWFGPSTSDDCWGRAVWALGTTIARAKDDALRLEALEFFERGAQVRSQWPRSMAFATLGAVEVLKVDPKRESALRLAAASAKVLDRPVQSEQWRWPEERLTYSNAALAEAMLAAGSVIGDDHLIETGLEQLKWLLDLETSAGHLSVTPTGGRGPDSGERRFDQQPIEVAAMSDACARALDLTGDVHWAQGQDLAVQWFMGNNDVGSPMYDSKTGGGYDGLTAQGPNLNQGTESTIALLTTLQGARRLAKTAS